MKSSWKKQRLATKKKASFLMLTDLLSFVFGYEIKINVFMETR